ncbi:glucosaminidase domain-containing protein, partial [Globicatella sulfidifaciens]
WVKSTDLSTHPHVGVDKDSKTFYIKGTGSAYAKAWGGRKDLVFEDMSNYKNYNFDVHLTEQVGKNVWYRGTLEGKVVWLHSNFIEETQSNITESSTSRLGHIRNSAVRIYKDLSRMSNYEVAGTNYTNAVYYIKKQAEYNGDLYYLISTEPSATKGVIGWVKSTDLSTHTHVGIDKDSKIFYFNGKGTAYTKAWGGRKDEVYSNMAPHTNKVFRVHLTEQVGNNIWYRGNYNGRIIWVHSSFVSDTVTLQSKYDYTLENMIDIQMGVAPQTDKYSKSPAYVHSSLVDREGSSGEINGNSVRVRSEPNTTSHIYGSLNTGRKVSILGEVKGSVVSGSDLWYQISYTTWRLPTRSDLMQFVDPKLQDPFQFLILSQHVGILESALNAELSGKGVLHNKGNKFIEGSKKYSVNEAYLVSHAILETGNGTSNLANGIEVGLNSSGEAVLVTSSNRKNLSDSDIKKVYNVYGIGARDQDPERLGAIYAYEKGWTSVDIAIIEGAQFVSGNYFGRGQNTLYKMRWNPAAPGTYQYATDIGWASKQISRIKNIYGRIDNAGMAFDIPIFK